jgi:methionyl-tRNA formyltransferase
MIRALYPWPVVWSKIMLNNEEKIIKFFPGKKVQIAGKNVMSLKDFLNGYPQLRDEIGKIL